MNFIILHYACLFCCGGAFVASIWGMTVSWWCGVACIGVFDKVLVVEGVRGP